MQTLSRRSTRRPRRIGLIVLAALSTTIAQACLADRPARGTAARSSAATPAPPRVERESALSAVWANDGGDKVTQDELRATRDAGAVESLTWDGRAVTLVAARNEVVAFNLVLEAGERAAERVSVALDELAGPNGARIRSRRTNAEGVYDWRGRNIELFHVRYLPVRGISRFGFGGYDERHLPDRMQRPHDADGTGRGGWGDRPDADKNYPDIAVPLERVGEFGVARGQNQSVWVDVYVPKRTRPGVYRGHVVIHEAGQVTRTVPVRLDVRPITLPDTPAAKTMLFLGYGDINERYLGERWPGADRAEEVHRIRDLHFMMAHRHKISLIDADETPEGWREDAPSPRWRPRLDGSLFTRRNGYAGPGEGVGNGIYSIGTYGSWWWKDEGEAGMRAHTDAWEQWFRRNSPDTERFLYLADETRDFPELERWAQWMDRNPGPGRALPSMATVQAPEAVDHAPSVDVVVSYFSVNDPDTWVPAVRDIRARGRFYAYNGARPATGTFFLEDDGVALRQLAWAQHKMDIPRWYYWESTYYNNFQGGEGQTNVFRDASTFGGKSQQDPVYGRTGWNHSNGEAVLFYPGTDRIFPEDSLGLAGPIASTRLKMWRRGIQDIDYLKLAERRDPRRVRALVQRMVPKALWEYGVQDRSDPTWVLTEVSWSIDPDDWERARRELIEIIEGD